MPRSVGTWATHWRCCECRAYNLISLHRDSLCPECDRHRHCRHCRPVFLGANPRDAFPPQVNRGGDRAFHGRPPDTRSYPTRPADDIASPPSPPALIGEAVGSKALQKSRREGTTEGLTENSENYPESSISGLDPLEVAAPSTKGETADRESLVVGDSVTSHSAIPPIATEAPLLGETIVSRDGTSSEGLKSFAQGGSGEATTIDAWQTPASDQLPSTSSTTHYHLLHDANDAVDVRSSMHDRGAAQKEQKRSREDHQHLRDSPGRLSASGSVPPVESRGLFAMRWILPCLAFGALLLHIGQTLWASVPPEPNVVQESCEQAVVEILLSEANIAIAICFSVLSMLAASWVLGLGVELTLAPPDLIFLLRPRWRDQEEEQYELRVLPLQRLLVEVWTAVRWLLRPPKLNHIRVLFRCACRGVVWSDYPPEHAEGAFKLQSELRTFFAQLQRNPPSNQGQSFTDRLGNVLKASLEPVRVLKQYFGRTRRSLSLDSEAHPRQSSRSGTPTQTDFYLTCCRQEGEGIPWLFQLPSCETEHDAAYFEKLRTVSRNLQRRRQRWLTPRTVVGVQYVQVSAFERRLQPAGGKLTGCVSLSFNFCSTKDTSIS